MSVALTVLFQTFIFEVQASQKIILKVNAQDYSLNDTLMKNERVYVPVREFVELLGAAVQFDDEKKEIMITKNNLELKLYQNDKMVYYNGEKLYMDSPTISNQEMTYVSLRFLAEAMYQNVIWDSETNNIYIEEKPTYVIQEGDTLSSISSVLGISAEDLRTWNHLSDQEPIVNQKLYLEPVVFTALDEIMAKAVIAYQDDEINWLAKIIFAEAQDEPYEGLVAVGAVIVNRVQSSNFPDTIYDVIFQTNQFSPVRTGKIYDIQPDEASYKAAYEALVGVDPVEGALYFYNPRVTKSSFFTRKTLIGEIGNHRFVK